jgi:hypothetical protein
MDAAMASRLIGSRELKNNRGKNMNAQFHRIIAASPDDRLGLFLSTAHRLGTPVQHVEKDFWVCWILDLLFNGRKDDEPRLLFKGGTSLSKAYGLISRFSEDLDITVFREDLGQDIEVIDLENLSGKQQRKHLDNIQKACQTYINGALQERLNRQVEMAFKESGEFFDESIIVQDPDDAAQQTLLIYYPSVTTRLDEYVKPIVKIEGGAKSALDPHRLTCIQPYISGDMLNLDLTIKNIVTIDADRTFWDKIMILHGLRRWYDNRGELRQQGHRVSRHYYDLYKLIDSSIGQQATTNQILAHDCARHAQIFFNSNDLDLKHARPGFFTLVPTPSMQKILKRDYQAMSGMIFGEIPDFSEVIEVIQQLETAINNLT